jgi:hypothetical protein
MVKRCRDDENTFKSGSKRSIEVVKMPDATLETSEGQRLTTAGEDGAKASS